MQWPAPWSTSLETPVLPQADLDQREGQGGRARLIYGSSSICVAELFYEVADQEDKYKVEEVNRAGFVGGSNS